MTIIIYYESCFLSFVMVDHKNLNLQNNNCNGVWLLLSIEMFFDHGACLEEILFASL